MSDDSTTQGVLFTGLFEKPLSARFDQPDMSSDGGAVLAKFSYARLTFFFSTNDPDFLIESWQAALPATDPAANQDRGEVARRDQG